jgi:hypothetical protein
MILGKCVERRPRGRGRFTLEDSIEVDFNEITYKIIYKCMVLLSEFGIMGTRQRNSGLHTDEKCNENRADINFAQRAMFFTKY